MGSHNTFRGNICSQNGGAGIGLVNSSSNTVENNACEANGQDGVVLDSASGNIIDGNDVNLNHLGVYLLDASENELTENRLHDNELGINIRGSDIGSSENVVFSNTVSNSQPEKLSLYLNNATANTFFFNAFYSQVQSNAVGNQWFSEEEIRYLYNGNWRDSRLGNYYFDNTQPDQDGDGLSDSIYQIEGNEGGLDEFALVFDPNQTYCLESAPWIWYRDQDGDGFGDPNAPTPSCQKPIGYVRDNTDCDDNDPVKYPGQTWYYDLDGDGLGDPNDSIQSCEPPVGYVDNADDDCPDGRDTDQDGVLNCVDDFPNDPQEWFDTDEDGEGDNADSDDDNDGIPDRVENAGPNNGDGNSDGTLDSLQLNVTSMKTYDGSTYVTLEVPDGAHLEDCRAESPQNPPAGFTFPYGLFAFTIQGIDPDGHTTLAMYLPAEAEPSSYYKFGPEPDNNADHWYEFLLDNETGAEIDENIITLHFIDGRRGDDNVSGLDGMIEDIGGPAVAQEDGAENPTGSGSNPTSAGGGGGGGGCFIAGADSQPNPQYFITGIMVFVIYGIGGISLKQKRRKKRI